MPATLTLLDVLQEVPRLPELLTTDAQKDLSAVSRKFRECFAAQVQAVTLTCEEDLALLDSRRWPHLSMVIVEGGRFPHGSHPSLAPMLESYVNVLSNDSLASMLVSYISVLSNERVYTIFMLRPAHSSACDMVWGFLGSSAAGSSDDCQVA